MQIIDLEKTIKKQQDDIEILLSAVADLNFKVAILSRQHNSKIRQETEREENYHTFAKHMKECSQSKDSEKNLAEEYLLKNGENYYVGINKKT